MIKHFSLQNDTSLDKMDMTDIFWWHFINRFLLGLTIFKLVFIFLCLIFNIWLHEKESLKKLEPKHIQAWPTNNVCFKSPCRYTHGIVHLHALCQNLSSISVYCICTLTCCPWKSDTSLVNFPLASTGQGSFPPFFTIPLAKQTL